MRTTYSHFHLCCVVVSLQDLSSAHSKAVMGVAWPVAGDSAAAQLVSCGADRSIKVFGAAAV